MNTNKLKIKELEVKHYRTLKDFFAYDIEKINAI